MSEMRFFLGSHFILKWLTIKNLKMIEHNATYNLKALELLFKIVYNIANKIFHFHKLL